MNTTEILSFKSHTAGKNADVTVFSDRIEWVQKTSRLTSPLFWALTIFTGGLWALVLLIPSKSSAEMLPIKSVTSVLASRGSFFTEITVVAAGNTVAFRVYNADADRVKNTLTSLVMATA